MAGASRLIDWYLSRVWGHSYLYRAEQSNSQVNSGGACLIPSLISLISRPNQRLPTFVSVHLVESWAYEESSRTLALQGVDVLLQFFEVGSLVGKTLLESFQTSMGTDVRVRASINFCCVLMEKKGAR